MSEKRTRLEVLERAFNNLIEAFISVISIRCSTQEAWTAGKSALASFNPAEREKLLHLFYHLPPDQQAKIAQLFTDLEALKPTEGAPR